MLKKILVIAGLMMLFAAVISACGTTATEEPTEVAPEATPIPTETSFLVSFEDEWKASGHNDVAGEPFRHWDGDDPAEVPTSCAKCHSSAGFIDFAADGTVDAAVPAVEAQGVTCDTCHSPEAMAMSSVTFPSGAVVSGLGGEARCMTCHQGRESTVSVDKQIADFNATDPDAVVAPITVDGQERKFGFRNVHYYAAAATLYGNVAKGGYEYDGKMYDAKNDHTQGYDTCLGCHDQHTLEVKVDECAMCHEGVTSVEDLKKVRIAEASFADYDGDGNLEEGMAEEITGLQEILFAEIQKYAADKAGTEIVYDPAAYPYFFIDTNANGTVDEGEAAFPNAYANWSPRLLKAAYNYQVSVKDPGAFAHGNKYIVQLLHDSIEDLGGDVSTLARDDAGHFAGNTEPFRHWDEEGDVPFGCAKCHAADGLPTFLENGGSTVVAQNGTTVTTGLGNVETSNGFQCATCHNEQAWPERYSIASVVFPSGKSVSLGGKDADGKFVADDSNLCLSCHMGRESTTSMNVALKGKEADTIDSKLGFKNVHYFAAGATLFGNDAQGAYQYAGKEYLGQNTTHPIGKCADCHDVHELEVKSETCAGCHPGVEIEDIRIDKTDFDGDGDVEEGIKGEIDTLSAALYAEIQAYAAKNSKGIVYDSHTYPYFFVDADGDGVADKNDQGANIGYTGSWTPRLLQAAYNYQYTQKDPGAFTHNPKYVIQFLIDSIDDLGGDTGSFTRPTAGE
jgi:hypothetical protein